MLVGELHAKITAETSGFDNALSRSESNFGKFTGLVSKGATTVANVITGIGVTTGGIVGALAKTGGAYNSLQQNSLQALTVMLGSTEAAHAQLEKFNEFASTSPFGRDTFLAAQQQLLGFGTEAENVVPILDAVQNAVAGIGGSNDDILQIGDAFAQIESQGKITGRELQRLGASGIDAAQMIADATGETREEVLKNISASKYDAETTMDALVAGMQTKFGGTAALIKDQWTGATDRIKAAWRDIGGDLMAPFIDPMGGGYAVVWANDIADIMRALQSKIEPIMAEVVRRWGSDFDGFSLDMQKLASDIRAIDLTDITSDTQDLAERFVELAPVLALVGGGLAGVATQTGILAPIFGALGFSVSPLVGAMLALMVSTEDNRASTAGLGEALMALIGTGSKVVGVFAEVASGILNAVTPAFIDLAAAVVEAGTPFLATLVPAIEVTGAVLTPIASALGAVAEWLAGLPQPVLLASAAFLSLKTGIGPLPATVQALTTVGSKLGDVFGGLVSKLKPASTELVKIGGVTHQSATGMNLISTNATGASSSISGLAGAARTAGAALKAAFIANAVGLAITAIVTALGAFSAQSQKTAGHVDTLANSMDELGHATDGTREALYDILADDDLPERFEAVGISSRELIDALTEGGQAYEDLQDKLSGMRAEGYTEWTQAEINELRNLSDALEKQKDKTDEASEAARRKARATGEATDATKQAIDATDEEIEKAYHAADANRDHVLSIEELRDAQDRQANAVANARKAALDYAEAQQKVLDVSDGLAGVTADEERALLGYFDTITRNIQAQKEAGASTAELRDLMAGSRSSFIEAAVAIGFTAEEAAAYADELNLIPENVESKTNLHTAEALIDLSQFAAEIDLTEGTVTVNGNTYPAAATLAELGFEIDESTGTVEIMGNTYPADTALGELVALIDSESGDVDIGGITVPGQEALGALLTQVNRSDGKVTIGGRDYPAEQVRQALLGRVNTSNGSIRILSAPAAFNRWLNGVNGKVIGTSYIQVGTVGGTGYSMSQGADGGSVRRGELTKMDNGGSRQAMVAKAGSYILWAENETEDETYIPHALPKRARSLRIMGATADEFGYSLVPKALTNYANGGSTAGHSMPAPASPGLPPSVTLMVGDRAFTAYVAEVADGRLESNRGVQLADDLARNYSAYKTQLGS